MMNIQLEHPFRYKCHNLLEILKDTNKLLSFCNKLKKYSKDFPDRYDPDKYVGDGFELFTEFLIKASPVDNRIGITNYQIEKGLDVGVDGYGIGSNGKPATVQVKFRSDSSKNLTANLDHLSNFRAASLDQYKVDRDDTNNMLIITTANGLHHFTDNEMFGNKVRCLGYNKLRLLVDNNLPFWDLFRKSLYL